MARKDYKAGMEAGAKPFEEKFQKQADAVERVGARIESRLNDISAVQDVILKDLSAREKKELYDLNTVVDIGELEESEKEFLVAVLFTLSNMTDCVSEHQQAFIRSVKTYLGIKNAQTDVDLSYIENIDSKRQTRAILQTVMEFLFLENCTHDYLDEYDDILDYFDVKASEVHKIERNIDRIYNATGAIGLAEKYGFVPNEASYVQNQPRIYIGNLQKYMTNNRVLFSCRAWLMDISSCTDLTYINDDIYSRSEAERRAKNKFSSIYSSAKEFFSVYSSKSISKTATQELVALVKSDAITLLDTINNLSDDIKAKNKTMIQELQQMLSMESLQRKIKEVAEKELENRYYTLSDMYSYLATIEYEMIDNREYGGWEAIIHPYSWRYDGCDTWMTLSQEVDNKVELYMQGVSNAFRYDVIRPIVNLIKLMDGVDIVETEQTENKKHATQNTTKKFQQKNTFKMTIQDVFTISGCGTVVTGIIEEGTIKKNDTACYVEECGTSKTVKIIEIESLHQILDTASAGMNVGLLIEGISKEEVCPGSLITNT